MSADADGFAKEDIQGRLNETGMYNAGGIDCS